MDDKKDQPQEPADYVNYDIGPFDLQEANPELEAVSHLPSLTPV